MPTCRKDATVGTDHTVQIITIIIKRCYSTGKERYELGKQYVAERQHSTNLLANVLYSIAVLIDREEGRVRYPRARWQYVCWFTSKEIHKQPYWHSDCKLLWLNSRVDTGTVKGTIRHKMVPLITVSTKAIYISIGKRGLRQTGSSVSIHIHEFLLQLYYKSFIPPVKYSFLRWVATGQLVKVLK